MINVDEWESFSIYTACRMTNLNKVYTINNEQLMKVTTLPS